PCMAAHRVPARRDVLQDVRVPERMLADDEERGLGAVLIERVEHGLCVVRPRTIVECEDDLLRHEEIVHTILLEAESGSAGRVDLDGPRNAKCPGIARTARMGGC